MSYSVNALIHFHIDNIVIIFHIQRKPKTNCIVLSHDSWYHCMVHCSREFPHHTFDKMKGYPPLSVLFTHLSCCLESLSQHPLKGLSLGPGGCFTNVPRALQNNRAKMYNARNNNHAENFKLKLCTCAQTMGTHTKFQLEILIRSTILVIYKFWENILESLRNVSETSPWWWLDSFTVSLHKSYST